MFERKELEELILMSSFGDDTFINDEEALLMLALLKSQRYIIPRSFVPKSLEWFHTAMLNFDDELFRTQFRVKRQSFYLILSLISGHEIFTEAQDPVYLQLAVTLFRLGTFGNASSIKHVGTKFGIGVGGVARFTKRIITAITSLSKKYIYWPSAGERREIGLDMAEVRLPKCIGFVDGTDIIFCDAPLNNKEFYWSRKKKYCLQAQIVCDPSRRIRDLFAGYPGSVHDAKVFGASPVGQQPHKFFSQGEFIIGDSAYALTENCVVPFKRSLTGLTSDKKAFNHHLSIHRVGVENTIGLLKNRFQSLKGLRIRISSNGGHAMACDWIHACAVLHNVLLQQDPWDENAENTATINDGDGNSQEQKSRRGNLKREALFQIFKAMRYN